MSIFINFYWELIIKKLWIHPVTWHTILCLHVFSFKWTFYIFFNIDFYLVKMTLCCLNPTPVLNLFETVVLQPMITLAAYSLCKNSIGLFFLIYLLFRIYVFYSVNDILLYSVANCYDLTLSYMCFFQPQYSVTIYNFFYTISFLHFSADINHID